MFRANQVNNYAWRPELTGWTVVCDITTREYASYVVFTFEFEICLTEVIVGNTVTSNHVSERRVSDKNFC